MDALLTARCPSCSAPVEFVHATSVASVCRACRTTVVRSGSEVRDFGKVASIARDLSPIRIGARGMVDGVVFEVVGVIRRGREDVRWNEWFVHFDDGRTAWIGEGNGTWQLYDRSAPVKAPPQVAPGGEVDLGGVRWVATEVGDAVVLAAEGELPYPVRTAQRRRFVDLREAGGHRAGTLDLGDDVPLLYVGRVVALPDLKLVGLRRFRGFDDDPDLGDFDGPDIAHTRAVTCPKCTGPLEITAAGDAQTIGCPACGSTSKLAEAAGELVASLVEEGRDRFGPVLPLGSVGRFDGAAWRVIGALRREVNNEWGAFPWTEMLLYNPYRGFRWLIEDTRGHFSLVEPLPCVPVNKVDLRTAHPAIVWDGETYKHFQSGVAETRAVVGELTWAARIGDRARTEDFVHPPRMISREGTGHEVVWSLGTYLDADEVSEAFGKTLERPEGPAPHRPNPYGGDATWNRTLRNVLILCAGAAALWGYAVFAAANEILVDGTWTTSSAVEDVFISEPFVVPDVHRRGLQVEVFSEVGRDKGLVHVALLNTDDGRAWLPSVASNRGNTGTARVSGVTPGQYVARVEVAKPEASRNPAGETVRLVVTRDVPYYPPLWLAILIPMLGPLFQVFASWQFENTRWQDSDYAS